MSTQYWFMKSRVSEAPWAVSSYVVGVEIISKYHRREGGGDGCVRRRYRCRREKSRSLTRRCRRSCQARDRGSSSCQMDQSRGPYPRTASATTGPIDTNNDHISFGTMMSNTQSQTYTRSLEAARPIVTIRARLSPTSPTSRVDPLEDVHRTEGRRVQAQRARGDEGGKGAEDDQ